MCLHQKACQHESKDSNFRHYFVFLTGNKNTEKAPGKQSDSESDTEDDKEKKQAAPGKKKCEPQLCILLFTCH